MTQYKYWRVSPNTHGQTKDIHYLPGHSYGLLKRRDKLTISTQASQVYCSCGWKDKRWITARWQLAVIFNRHIDSVANQGRFF